MSEPAAISDNSSDRLVESFLRHLTTERAASVYTLRNYEQVLKEFSAWFITAHGSKPHWPALQRDQFRAYLRFLGRNQRSRAAIQLRFSALRSFYKFLIRRGELLASPIKQISLPKSDKRLPQFLTRDQMIALLGAPLRDLELLQGASETPVQVAPCLRD